MTGEDEDGRLVAWVLALGYWAASQRAWSGLGCGGQGGRKENPFGWIQLQIVSLTMHTPPYNLGV